MNDAPAVDTTTASGPPCHQGPVRYDLRPWPARVVRLTVEV